VGLRLTVSVKFDNKVLGDREDHKPIKWLLDPVKIYAERFFKNLLGSGPKSYKGGRRWDVSPMT